MVADEAVAKFFYGCGVAFNKVQEQYFKDMCTAVGSYGAAYKPPNINQLRGPLLDSARNSLEKQAEEVFYQLVHKHGLTICSDGWSDVCMRALLNILAANHNGSLFLKAVDTKGETKVCSLYGCSLTAL